MAASPELREIVGRMIEAGESEENIAAVIQRMTAPSTQTDHAEPESSTISRVGSGAYNALKGMAGAAWKASGVPGMMREGTIGAIKDQAETAKALFYDAPAAMFERARTAETLPEKVGYAAAGVLPGVGPLAGHIGTEIAEGRTPELMGELAVGASLPFVPKGGRIAAKGARAVAAGARSVAESELLSRLAKRSARSVGAAVGGGVGGLIAGGPGATGGAIIGSEVGQMIHGALRNRSNRAPVPEIVPPVAPQPTGRPIAGELPPAPIEMGPAPDGSYVRSIPAEYPEVSFPPKMETPTPKKARAVDQLKDKIEQREIERISKELGTTVRIARREPQRRNGRFTGRTEPVYVMPAEFVEAAQMMGLRAETPTGRAMPMLPRKVDAQTGLPLNEDGTVTVYHHTSKAASDRIRKEGVLRSAGEPDVYVTTTETPTTGYGDTVVAVRVKPSKLLLDDEFPDGRRDFRIEGRNVRVGVGK